MKRSKSGLQKRKKKQRLQKELKQILRLDKFLVSSTPKGTTESTYFSVTAKSSLSFDWPHTYSVSVIYYCHH